MVDYEAELAVAIGKAGHRIAASQWEEHVFGYTMMNDVSARDVQRATSQWSLGKSFPTFAPMGPWVVSKDEIADPHRLGISHDDWRGKIAGREHEPDDLQDSRAD